MSPAVHALVPAAGRGERFGGPGPKQFLEINARPLLSWTLERLWGCAVASLTVALPEAELTLDPAARFGVAGVCWVRGGRSRQQSVARCLAACPGGPRDLVLVHDGARPAVAVSDVAAVVAAAAGADGAILGRALGDTLKRVEAGEVRSTVDRHGLFRAETPQVFRREVLERALALAREEGFEGTDEAALVERLPGCRVLAVAARHPNPKLTEPADRVLVEALLGG